MTKIQIRRDSTSTWNAVNPVLNAGEFGLDLDTGAVKVGDGSSTWSALAEVNGGITQSAADARYAATGDSRIVGASQKSSNLSDLASAVTARLNLGVDTRVKLASDPAFGVWPTGQAGDVTANLDAAMSAAWDGTNKYLLLIPNGIWTYSGNGYQGTSDQIMLAGLGRHASVISLTAGKLLINITTANNVLIIDNLKFLTGWGVYRNSYQGTQTSGNAHRYIRYQHTNFTGTSLSSAASDQAYWDIDVRLVAVDPGSDPGVNGGTIGVALNGLIDGSRIHVDATQCRVPVKLGSGGHVSNTRLTVVRDATVGRTWWNSAAWTIPDMTGPVFSVTFPGPGRGGGEIYFPKIGNEGLQAAIDYHLLTAEQTGTIYASSGFGGLFVQVKPSTTIPSGWTVDVTNSGSSFTLTVKLNGVTQETSPSFSTLQAAAAWAATTVVVTDTSGGFNTTGLPATVTNVPIGDFTTAMPSLPGMQGFSNSQAWLEGATVRAGYVASGNNAPNPPLWTLTIPPAKLLGCAIEDVCWRESSASTQDPNWPTYAAKFIGDTTAVTTRPLNRINNTKVNTTRKVAATPNAAQIPPSNVAGVFALPADLGHHVAVPTGTIGSAAGSTATITSITGNDRKFSVTINIPTGATGQVAGDYADITFGQPFGRTPRVTVTNAANTLGASAYRFASSATGCSLGYTGAVGTNKNVTLDVTVEPDMT